MLFWINIAHCLVCSATTQLGNSSNKMHLACASRPSQACFIRILALPRAFEKTSPHHASFVFEIDLLVRSIFYTINFVESI